jgi:endonuclease III
MKNAAKHADALRTLFRRLLREHPPDPMVKRDALQAVVRGAMSYDVSDAKADEAVRLIEREFVDLNELRVATDLEIAELLGTRYPDIKRRVEMITRALNMIFEKEHTLNMERMGTLSRRDVREFLRELPDIHPFVDAYVMLFAFEGHCVPVDQEILNYLVEEGVCGPKMDIEAAQRFLEHHLKAEECFQFYAVVRLAAHGEAAKTRKKAKA